MNAKNDPKPPSHLSKQAASLWSSVMRDYRLEDWQQRILLSACEAQDTLTVAMLAVERHGVVIEQPNGTLKANPATITARDARHQLFQHLKGLNLDMSPPTGKGK